MVTSSPTFRFHEVLEKAETGPVCLASEFDKILSRKIKELIKKI